MAHNPFLRIVSLLKLVLLAGCATSFDGDWLDDDDGLAELDRTIAQYCSLMAPQGGGLRWIRTSAHRDRFRVSTDFVISPAPGFSQSTSHVVMSAANFGRASIEFENSFPDDGYSEISIRCPEDSKCVHNETSGSSRNDSNVLDIFCETDDDEALTEAFLNLQAYYQSGRGIDDAAFVRGFATPRRPLVGDNYPLTIVVINRNSLSRELRLDTTVIRSDMERYFGELDTVRAGRSRFLGPVGRGISSVRVLSPRQLRGDYSGFFYYVDIGEATFVRRTEAGVMRCYTSVTFARAHTTGDTEELDPFASSETIFETINFGRPDTRRFYHNCGDEGVGGDIESEDSDMEGLTSAINERLRTWVSTDWRR